MRTMHIESNSRLCMASAGNGLQAVARRRRTAGVLHRLRPDRPVLRDRLQHGRLSSDPVPAHGRPAQGGGQADRGRPASHHHRREGRPVSADQARHRPGAAQRTYCICWSRAATSTPSSSPSTPRAGTRCPRFLADYPPDVVAGITGSGRGGHPHRRDDDRRGGGVDVLLDDGAEPEHPRHLEHQRDLQPAPGHRRDLPAGQRTDVADRAAQRHGRARDGLHGAGAARPARGAPPPRTGRSSRRSGAARRHHPHRRRPGHHRDVRQARHRRDQGVLDHLHQSRCHAWPTGAR